MQDLAKNGNYDKCVSEINGYYTENREALDSKKFLSVARYSSPSLPLKISSSQYFLRLINFSLRKRISRPAFKFCIYFVCV